MVQVVPDSSQFQVADDPELLELMLKDQAESPEIYRATPYWASYEEATVQLLRSEGLKNFRRNPKGFLPSFGATDLPPELFDKTKVTDIPPNLQDAWATCVASINQWIGQGLPILPGAMSMADVYELIEAAAATAVGFGAGKPDPRKLNLSRVGNPYGFLKDGRFKTLSGLYYFNMLGYVSRFVDLSSVQCIVELGSGSGKQVEVTKALFPHLTFVLVDLAPQLYVAERFLTGAFPSEVVPYRSTRDRSKSLQLESGEIYFLANARIEDLQPQARTLFWNSASFGEMEPEIVQNYGKHIGRFASWLFLMQLFAGKQAMQTDGGGVRMKTKMEDYQAAFPSFELINRQPASSISPFQTLAEDIGNYEYTFWEKQLAEVP